MPVAIAVPAGAESAIGVLALLVLTRPVAISSMTNFLSLVIHLAVVSASTLIPSGIITITFFALP